MHIIALASEPNSSKGGQERSLLDVCRSLHQRGHGVSLLYLKEGDLLEQYREFCTHVVQVHAYKVLRKKDLFRFIQDYLSVPKVKDAVVYSNQYYDCVMGYALARSRNIPLICHIRTPAPKQLDRSDWQQSISLNGIDQFITVSGQIKTDLIKLGFQEDRINVVHNGTNIERFKPAENFAQLRAEWEIPLDAKVFSYVGRLDQVKGVECLIKAFSLLFQQTRNVKLLIAGEPVVQKNSQGQDYWRSLQHLPKDLGIEDQVSFLGQVSNTVSLYQVSDISVLPSIYAEPFARSVIESMACGTPVVGSRTGGTPEALTGEFEAMLFEPNNEQDLFKKMDQVLNWRANDPTLGNRCREHIVKNFTLEQAINQIEAVMLREVSKLSKTVNSRKSA